MTTIPDRVRMTGISKRYGPIQTLSDVSLHLAPGEVLGLVGDNGAGKSDPPPLKWSALRYGFRALEDGRYG